MTDLDPRALEAIADQLERDRREPDKVLTYVQKLRRLATDLNQAGQSVPGSGGVERARRLAKDIEIDCDGLLEPEQVASLADEIRGNAQLILEALQPVEREDEVVLYVCPECGRWYGDHIYDGTDGGWYCGGLPPNEHSVAAMKPVRYAPLEPVRQTEE